MGHGNDTFSLMVAQTPLQVKFRGYALCLVMAAANN